MSNIWYGSLNNRLAERAQQPTPVVGMGVTECCYSDRHPWEIIEVKDEKHITIRQIHGSWGGCAIQPEHDTYEILVHA